MNTEHDCDGCRRGLPLNHSGWHEEHGDRDDGRAFPCARLHPHLLRRQPTTYAADYLEQLSERLWNLDDPTAREGSDCLNYAALLQRRYDASLCTRLRVFFTNALSACLTRRTRR